MSFVMIATGATRHGRVRTLSTRHLLLGGGLASLALMAAGGALGYWLAAPVALPSVAAPLAGIAAPAPAERPHAALPFALEQLGALSGRLFRLESQAAQLSKRIGVLLKDDGAARDRKPGSGGPLLPPRAATSEALSELDQQIARLEEQIARVSDATTERSLDQMRTPSRLPIRGAEIVSGFGNRTDPIAHRQAFHAGLDFAAGTGTPIVAAAGGKVVFAGFHHDFGYMVEIEHGNGLTTRYAHASKLLVQPGAIVTPGEKIAMVGSTGRSTGPHLHFEVLRRGGQVDPRQYLARL